MGGVVHFDIVKFREWYPEVTLTDAQLQLLFIKAGMQLNNTEHSCVQNLLEREVLLYLLVAHLAILRMQVEKGNTAVGRVASATEGSVSVSFDYGQTLPNEKWFAQTPYGAEYWQLTKKYRSIRYVVTKLPMRVRR
ncbi:DUF4054 domain-containing protein [Acinetobacter stercoris]|uniref:DUF4054 domain-containing protein n=1 Tax=Acinetobacter stercoris TaxID=2126983 RepID=A0A2U3MZL1_9GAMM|nr:DUF4054 domain-containing protein [Acinetobacter stercoris]SPL70858.1 hypothetical protein KPC_2036 [Acinetobacter stercoris]